MLIEINKSKKNMIRNLNSEKSSKSYSNDLPDLDKLKKIDRYRSKSLPILSNTKYPINLKSPIDRIKFYESIDPDMNECIFNKN